MPFNDTSNKQGLIQDCETWTNLGDGVISGDSTLKAQFTRLMNVHNAKIQAELQLLTGAAGPEDTNYSSQQFSTFDIVANQNDYTFTVDEAGNTISDITGISILTAVGSTEYLPLRKLTLDDPRAQLIMSPNPTRIGVPSGFLEKNSTVFFDTLPVDSITDGGKLFYRLVPSYFVAADDTKKPGFAEGYHRILSVRSSIDWLAINKPEATVLIERAMSEDRELMAGLRAYTRQRNPTRRRVVGERPRSI
jgi:hypothetical protein